MFVAIPFCGEWRLRVFFLESAPSCAAKVERREEEPRDLSVGLLALVVAVPQIRFDVRHGARAAPGVLVACCPRVRRRGSKGAVERAQEPLCCLPPRVFDASWYAA